MSAARLVRRPEESRAKRVTIAVIAAVILIPGAIGFAEKIVQFVRTLDAAEGGRFTIVPLMNYLLMALGFLLLLLWGVAHGMFRDIEGPKYAMLDREAALDARDGVARLDDGRLASTTRTP